MPPKTLPKTRRNKRRKKTSKNKSATPKPVSAWNGKRGVVGFRTLPQDITEDGLSENVANCFKSRFQNVDKGNG